MGLAASTSGGGEGFGNAKGSKSEDEEISEVMARDMLIDTMLQCSKSEEQLTSLVNDSILSLDKEFWLRFATRTDSTSSEAEKENLTQLANKVMQITHEMVKKSEGAMEDASSFLVEILSTAADASGSWHLPLSLGESRQMRDFMKANADKVNESLLATTYAWMRKASDDKENESVVFLLQKVLQNFAAERLLTMSLQPDELYPPPPPPTESSSLAQERLRGILMADESEWNAQLASFAEDGAPQTSEEALLTQLQMKKEMAVLGLQGGMYEQRVVVEFLQELETRIKSAFGSEEKAD